MTDRWSDGYVETNGIRIHYHRTGGEKPPVKPPIVLAHGITDNGLCWTPLARELEHLYDVIMVDARGHGLSDKPESGYGPHDHAADLAGLITALELAGPIVVGHSMGGGSAATLAYERPELVKALILEDPAWRAVEGAVRDVEADRLRAQDREENIRWRQSLSPEDVTATTRRDNPLWGDQEFPAHTDSKFQVSPNVMQFLLEPRKEWWEIVPALSCPMLVLTGDAERGAIITRAMAERIEEINPFAEVIAIANAGHNVRRDQFDEFLGHVRHFLQKLG